MRDQEEKHSIQAIPEFLKEESPLRERIKVIGEDGKPTYYGEDGDRINQEKHRAWREVSEEYGKQWMDRDCVTADVVEKEMIVKRCR